MASRYHLSVTVVANSWLRIPAENGVVLKVVGGNLDAADDWIVENIQAHDMVITADILLASRCLKGGAHVLGPSGKPFTDSNIGDAVATRDLLAELRSVGEITNGPPPFSQRDRSLFLQKFDELIQRIRREYASDIA